VDPIDELSELAVKYDIGLHVDSCLGGFLVPFLEVSASILKFQEAGYPLDHLCDFRLPGVTSISCDTHKYGYAPKGTSALVYRSKALRRYQYFVQPNWPGAIYASPTMAGSRPGGLVAAAWAAAACVGRSGYVARTKKIVETTRYIEEESKKIPGLFVYGKPSVSVVAWGATDFDIWQLYEQMSKRGWHLNALQYPSR
jgi:sphinganine-1-phosphate aldolase